MGKKENLGKFIKGHSPWNKGIKGIMKSWNKGKKLTEEHKKNLRKPKSNTKNMGRKKGYKMDLEHKEKISKSLKGISKNKGRKLSEKTKKKMGISHKNHICYKNPERGRKISESKKGFKHSEETKKKIGKSKKGQKPSRETIRKFLRRREKSSLEIKFEEMVNKLNLPYKFVGNGEFFIAKKCPDFINKDGEKIAIEVFARVHKEKFREGGLENWKKQRKEIFNNEGWEVVFFNETELNNDTLIKQRLGV